MELADSMVLARTEDIEGSHGSGFECPGLLFLVVFVVAEAVAELVAVVEVVAAVVEWDAGTGPALGPAPAPAPAPAIVVDAGPVAVVEADSVDAAAVAAESDVVEAAGVEQRGDSVRVVAAVAAEDFAQPYPGVAGRPGLVVVHGAAFVKDASMHPFAVRIESLEPEHADQTAHAEHVAA